MKEPWQIYPNAIPINTCKLISNRCSSYTQIPATIGFDGSQRTDKGYRKSMIRWIPPDEVDILRFYIKKYTDMANRDVYGFDVRWLHDIQHTEYPLNGKYDWHHDVDWLSDTASHRKLSFVLQLSNPDDYDGGVFQFKDFDQPDENLLRLQGTVLVFPSFLIHRVTPVTRGVRESIVSWVEGPKFV